MNTLVSYKYKHYRNLYGYRHYNSPIPYCSHYIQCDYWFSERLNDKLMDI